MFSAKGISTNVEQLRENLGYAGKRYAVYAGFIIFLEEGISKADHELKSNSYDVVAQKMVDSYPNS